MISIVASYYNRKDLFYQTLKSIEKSTHKDFEIIVVDDGSNAEHRVEDLTTEFPFLKIIRLEREKRWYVNPCVPYNIGMKEAQGDIIILQNPECFHVHDILSYVNENVNDTNYISISAYGANKEINAVIPDHFKNNTLVEYFKTLPQRAYVGYDSIGWYNHSFYRPVHYHFCSAITRNNMSKLNGFDERYSHGVGYDDDELLIRIRRLGLRLSIENNVSVIHQYHDTAFWDKPGVAELTEKNKSLLMNVTLRETRFDANLIKLWNKSGI